jgi:hypothetical protein
MELDDIKGNKPEISLVCGIQKSQSHKKQREERKEASRG